MNTCTCRPFGAIPEKHVKSCPCHPANPDYVPVVPQQPSPAWRSVWDHPRGEDFNIYG